ncbi:putative esterase PIR7A [Panicum miliaceum]|uniref:Esterase PIR7A n=1 Tax=Panicum miliaceum TaxID=4540 RepID=A0A3L6PK92_PANMI|nr:putative esterase PIR7A [Panicum miliaceum]
MENNGKKLRHHFVLVHGLCHGAWCWYKVATVLESAGHGVTALDLPGCGASAVRAEEVRSFEEYSRPLLRAVAAAPPGEKVVLVGHSFGGHNLALAMEAHPEKVAVAIFVSAPMPVAGRPMSAILEQHLQGDSASHSFLDCTFGIVETGSEDPAETFLVGPEWMSQRMYQLSPPEMFLRDEAMTGEKVLTEGRYGAVTRVFVVAEEDKTWPAEEQRRVAAPAWR